MLPSSVANCRVSFSRLVRFPKYDGTVPTKSFPRRWRRLNRFSKPSCVGIVPDKWLSIKSRVTSKRDRTFVWARAFSNLHGNNKQIRSYVPRLERRAILGLRVDESWLCPRITPPVRNRIVRAVETDTEWRTVHSTYRDEKAQTTRSGSLQKYYYCSNPISLWQFDSEMLGQQLFKRD
jgi:hypothetical protein